MKRIKGYLIKPVSLGFALAFLVACGGGGGNNDSAAFNASLTYTVEDNGQTRRFTTTLNGSDRLELELIPTPSNLRPKFSPDKNYYAYIKNNRLFVSRTGNNSVTELSQFQHGGASITQFIWAPNSEYLAYISDADTDNNFEAYVVTVNGSSHVQISPDIATIFVSGELQFSPDSNWITYKSNQDTANLFEGYVSRIDGTENRRFTGSIPSSSFSLARYTWSPDGRYIAYSVHDPMTFVRGINTHDTTIGGNDSVRISHDLSTVLANPIERFQWSPKSDLIAYSVRFGITGGGFVRRLFSARPGVSASSALTINGSVNDSVEVGEWAWSPDGDYIAYQVLSITATGIRQAEGMNTYDVIQGGNGSGNSTRVTDTTGGPLGQGFKTIKEMTWTSDSQYILYRSLIEKSNTIELYLSEPGVTASSTLLSLDVGIGNADDVGSFSIAPDGQQVAYSQRIAGTDSTYDIYVTDVSNPLADAQLSSIPVLTGQILPPSIKWSSQSTHIAFATDASTPDKRELYVAPNDGSGNNKVSGNIGAAADVDSFEFID